MGCFKKIKYLLGLIFICFIVKYDSFASRFRAILLISYRRHFSPVSKRNKRFIH